MSRALVPAVACLAIAACGNNAGSGAMADFTLASASFGDGRPLPAQFTCDGTDQSPPLAWSEPPRGTKSFALVVDDPDAPGGTFRHWGAYDIPASARAISAGEPIGVQTINDFGKPGYGGPCPPKGNGPHHYHFKLFALDADKLGLPANARAADVERAAKRHALGQGELIGAYERD